MSPGGKYSPTVGQVNVRCADGVHFTQSGGIFVGLRLAPELAALGQAHASAAPGGAWPGPSATIDTAMVANLPCPSSGRRQRQTTSASWRPRWRPATFCDDPVASYIFPTERRREAGLRAYFRTQMRADYLPFGGCYTTEGYAGSAIWAPAGKPLLTGLRAILTMLPVLPYVATNLAHDAAPLNLVESLHPHEPHWYLATLGVGGRATGPGRGRRADAPVLAHCDAEGMPCYLESSKERNVPFYRRHGFEVVKEVPLPGDGPPIWTMWREPQPGRGLSPRFGPPPPVPP